MKVTMEMNQVLTERSDLLYKYLETILQGMILLNSFTLLQMDRLQLTGVYCNRQGGVYTTPQMTCFRGAKVCTKWLQGEVMMN